MSATRVLTPDQQRAIDAPIEGPHVIDAGAGTGKTFTLVERAVRLVRDGQLQPDELLVITFAEKAAAEIRDRMLRAFRAGGQRDSPTCETFHALARRVRREFGFTPGWSPDTEVADEHRAREIFTRAFEEWRAGRLKVDTGAIPFLDRPDIIEQNLADLALRLKDAAISIDVFESNALEASSELERISYGWIWEEKTLRGVTEIDAKQCRPRRERTSEERRIEADREVRNVRAVAALFRRFDQLLLEERLATFGDLLLDAGRMLREHPEIVSALRGRWKHALVDELQDTSPVQIEFLRALFGVDLRPVLGVGDVRQAIYGFRGADPTVMRHFRELAGDEKVLPLERNRRSVQEILDAASAVMRQASDPLLPADHQLIAERAVDEADEPIAVRVEMVEADTADEAREREAAMIAREIARLRGRGVPPDELAILLRARTHAEPYRLALHSLGIPAKVHGDAGLYDAPEVRAALAWLRLLIEPDDDRAAIVVLQSKAAQLSDGAVASLAAETRSVALGLRRVSLEALAPADAGALRRLRAAFQLCASLVAEAADVAVARALTELGLDVAIEMSEPADAEQAAANLARLVEIAQDFTRDHPGGTLEEFVKHVEARRKAGDREPEPVIGGAEVGIYTIHAAKGLEWDYVFIGNVSPQAFPLQNENWLETVVLYDADRGRTSSSLAFKNAVDGTENLRWSLARVPHNPETGRKTSISRDEAEEWRLFYVALTRARRRVTVTGRKARNPSRLLVALSNWAKSTKVPPEQRLVELDAGGPAEVDMHHRDALAERELALAGRVLGRTRVVRPVPARAVSFTALATHRRCPRRARYQYLLRLPDLRDDAIILKKDAEGNEREPHIDADRYGNIVHGALEILAHHKFDQSTLQEAVTISIAEEIGSISDDQLSARVFADVSAACEALAGLEPLEPNGIEYEFQTTLAGVPVYGFIDLVARDGSGVWIVDYKTGVSPDEDYRVQLSLYGQALATLDHERRPERLALLRIGDGKAELRVQEPVADEELHALLQAAARLDDDSPRPGSQCYSCPYFHAPCAPAL